MECENIAHLQLPADTHLDQQLTYRPSAPCCPMFLLSTPSTLALDGILHNDRICWPSKAFDADVVNVIVHAGTGVEADLMTKIVIKHSPFRHCCHAITAEPLLAVAGFLTVDKIVVITFRVAVFCNHIHLDSIRIGVCYVRMQAAVEMDPSNCKRRHQK